MCRKVIGALALVVAMVGMPGQSLAHGITGSAAGKNTWEFIPLGIEHMLLGWDHLLFIAGIVLLAGELKRAAKLISVFVVGHSTTLIIATLAGWKLSATLVDVVIALSLVFVGVVGWIGRPQKWRWFAASVLGFGLVHGLGLSTRLQDLGLPESGLLWRVIAFNVGVEIGQLIGIVIMVVLGRVFARLIKWDKAPKLANGGLVAAGIVAAIVLSVLSVFAPAPPADAYAAGCSVKTRTETFKGEGNHPPKDFYEPSETAPESDFGHVAGDGYLVVQYSGLSEAQVGQLRTFITGPDGQKVVGGLKQGQAEQIKAINAYDTMSCEKFDLESLKKFADKWLTDPRSKSAEG
ncbi:HupE/UreJ family protein [Lentzea sp. BCCO 10_0798]|uniref:HupE/UreJ family protein n=1 Tax=Lentzea kristufekii TaxID=3095430 RepID=A0ABU4U0N2_9PSEU|nr:HupE/UreJ family protein [Lentzea sp. BCCO 10_0798]MDX8053682.1 HupE/UreJ family protein [Lentzea sp. BCCO 10_0798]